jgi:hypothetical protein
MNYSGVEMWSVGNNKGKWYLTNVRGKLNTGLPTFDFFNVPPRIISIIPLKSKERV